MRRATWPGADIVKSPQHQDEAKLFVELVKSATELGYDPLADVAPDYLEAVEHGAGHVVLRYNALAAERARALAREMRGEA